MCRRVFISDDNNAVDEGGRTRRFFASKAAKPSAPLLLLPAGYIKLAIVDAGGALGGAPLQFEKAACREYHVLYVFMSNNNMSLCLIKICLYV